MAEEGLGSGSGELGRHETSNNSHQCDNLLSKDQIKCLVDDANYKVLERYFLKKGKGRRPTLPEFTVLTNQLLVQLFFIKEETQSTFADLKSWVEKLVPCTQTISEGRLYHRVNAAMVACTSMPEDKTLAYLSEEVHFHAVHTALEALGLNRLHLTDNQPYTTAPLGPICNQVVVSLENFRANEGKDPIFVRKWIKRLSVESQNLTDSQLKNRVHCVLKVYRQLLKQKKKQPELEIFLNDSFSIKACNITKTRPAQSCNECLEKDESIAHMKSQLQDKENLVNKLLKDCDYLSSINRTLSSDIEVKNEILRELQQDKNLLLANIEEIKLHKSNADSHVEKIKSLLKTEKQEKEKMGNELDKIKVSSIYKQNHTCKRKLEDMTGEKDNLLKDIEEKSKNFCVLKEQIGSLKKKIKSEQTMKLKYKDFYNQQKSINSDMFQMMVSDDNNEKIALREAGSSHRFTDSIRKTFYALQGEANVSASNCSKVVSTVAKHLFKSDLSEEDLPRDTTALNLSNEAHIIAKEQIIDEIAKAKHFTFGCDGTSRDKVHFLEQHLYLSNGKTLSLGFSEIASDDSDTLLERCVGIFKDICQLHTIDTENNENDLMKEIISKMRCLLSDRAAVCKAFDTKMAEYKADLLNGEATTTHFIFCNAHFLLALSKAAEVGILEVEKKYLEDGDKLGRDGKAVFANWAKGEAAAIRLVRTAAEVIGPRCDEKSGCRQEWLAFCSARGIKSNFTSFRSNRFNNLFQNATAILHHHRHIEIFLTEYVSHTNLKLQSILADLKDKRIISTISVLAFLNTFFTNPYWQLMNSERKYVDFPQYVKKMRDCLTSYTSSDFNPFTSSSVFEDFSSKAEDVIIFTEFSKSNLFCISSFQTCLGLIVTHIQSSLNRQLSDFLEGGVFGGELDQEVKDILSTCPLTNLTGERLFGDLDFCMKKKRNASLHLRSTTNMWKHNSTARWLQRQSPSMARQLVKKAIKYGPEWKKRQKEEIKLVKDKIKRRIVENKKKKDEKETKKQERKLAAIDNLLAHGDCLATSKQELDTIFSGPQAFERLKDQIRYRSIVKGENISMTGNKKLLYERLRLHITSSSSTGARTSTM